MGGGGALETEQNNTEKKTGQLRMTGGVDREEGRKSVGARKDDMYETACNMHTG